MPSEWPLVPIGSVASVFDGPHATPKKTDAGPVFLGISSLNWGRLDLATTEHLSEDDFLKWTRRVSPQADDVVFSYETRLGQAAIIPPGLRCCLGRRMALVRTDNNRLLPRFFLYYFLSDEFQALLRSRTIHGSTVERLPLTDFPEFPVRLPPLSVQREIADALSALDDKIALLRETNATLEAIAQALFKSWFVDFDPVRAKAEGRDPEGVPSEVADLFPSEFEDSELGEIPKGWHVSTLAEHVTAERGLSYKGAGLCGLGEGRPMHNLNSVYEGGGYKYPGIKFYSGDFKERHLAVAGDIIVANTEQGHEHRLIGFPAIVPAIYPEGLFSHHLYRVRRKPSSPLTQRSLYYLLMAPYVREQIIGCANGSTVNMLKSAGLEIPRFVCPPAELAIAFEELAKPLHQRIEHNVQQADELAGLRDILLPRLMSGKLRIPEIQEAIEEATA